MPIVSWIYRCVIYFLGGSRPLASDSCSWSLLAGVERIHNLEVGEIGDCLVSVLEQVFCILALLAMFFSVWWLKVRLGGFGGCTVWQTPWVGWYKLQRSATICLFCKLFGISPDLICLQQYIQGWQGAQWVARLVGCGQWKPGQPPLQLYQLPCFHRLFLTSCFDAQSNELFERKP